MTDDKHTLKPPFFIILIATLMILVVVLAGTLLGLFKSAPIPITVDRATDTQIQSLTPQPPFIYVVNIGDTCDSIAQKFGVPHDNIISLNDLSATCDITPGQKIKLPSPRSEPVPDLPTEITDKMGILMRLVPAGTFIMGSDDDSAGGAKPAHLVALDSFYMDVYEVTRARYKECVTSGACSESRNLASVDSFYNEPNFPMAAVDWNQSQTYCEWRGARLPSEAEWEKAARGTDGRTYPWGEIFDPAYVKTSYDHQNETDGPAEVGMYEKGKSPYGMYDMSGGVWEWVADPYLAYPGYQGDDVFGQTYRVLRGGSWFYPDQYALSTWFRYSSSPDVADGSFGFRCARDVTP